MVRKSHTKDSSTDNPCIRGYGTKDSIEQKQLQNNHVFVQLVQDSAFLL